MSGAPAGASGLRLNSLGVDQVGLGPSARPPGCVGERFARRADAGAAPRVDNREVPTGCAGDVDFVTPEAANGVVWEIVIP